MAGHGWVTPNPDGSVARCGGPRMCDVCKREAGLLNLKRPASASSVKGNSDTWDSSSIMPITRDYDYGSSSSSDSSSSSCDSSSSSDSGSCSSD